MPTNTWLDLLIAGYNTIQSGGTAVPSERILNFVSGATVIDNPGQNRTDITIAAGAANLFTPEQFGAVGNGVTDDTAAFTSAMTALAGGGSLQLGANKTYLTTGGFTVPAGASIIGRGDSSVMKITANNFLFCTGGQNCLFDSFKMVGNATGSSQYGIANGPIGGSPLGNELTRYRNLTIESMGQAAIFEFNHSGTSGLNGVGVGVVVGPTFENIKVHSCPTYGLWIDAEYETLTNIQIQVCGEGLRIQAGNIFVTGGSVGGCTTGIHIIGGGNDGHGGITGIACNHNTTNLLCDNLIANGMPFVNCAFYGTGTSVQFVSSHAIRFVGCSFDVDNYYFDGSTGTIFDNCLFPSSFLNVIHNNFNSHASTTKFINPCNLNGVTPSFITSGLDGTDWQQIVDGHLDVYSAGTSQIATIGSDPGNAARYGVWLGLAPATSRVSGNSCLYSDGNFVILTAPTNTSPINFNCSGFNVGSLSLANWSLGFSDSRGVGTLLGSVTYSERSTAVNFTIDSGSVQDNRLRVTATCTVTLPAPSSGRSIRLILDSSGGSGITLTLARHASEKINGTAASATYTIAANTARIVDVETDGTNWFTT